MRIECGAPIKRPGSEAFFWCKNPAKWTHEKGCLTKNRCHHHSYKTAEGRACSYCGGSVREITKEA